MSPKKGKGKAAAAKAAATKAVHPPAAAAGDAAVHTAGSSAADTDAEAAALVAGEARPGVNPAVLAFNAVHMDYISQCLRVINAHPIFEGVVDKLPIKEEDGAPQAPFNEAKHKASMAGDHNCARSGCNFFWQEFGIDHMLAHMPVKKQN